MRDTLDDLEVIAPITTNGDVEVDIRQSRARRYVEVVRVALQEDGEIDEVVFGRGSVLR